MKNFIKLMEMLSYNIMYHRTSSDKIDIILKEGLKINSEINLTEGGIWAQEIYGCNPVYLSLEKNSIYASEASILLEVNVTNLDLVADFPSLVDTGAYYDIDEYLFWWKRNTPPNLPDEISFNDLLNSNNYLTEEVIQLTKSAACLENIAPHLIKLL